MDSEVLVNGTPRAIQGSYDPTVDQIGVRTNLEPDDRGRIHVRMSSAGRLTSEEEPSVSCRLKERAVHVAIPVNARAKVRVSYRNDLEWLLRLCWREILTHGGGIL